MVRSPATWKPVPLIYGHLPKKSEMQRFSKMLTQKREPARGHEVHFEVFPRRRIPWRSVGHDQRLQLLLPGANAAATRDEFDEQPRASSRRLRTIAAFSYRKSRGCPSSIQSPATIPENFLHMLFSDVYEDYDAARVCGHWTHFHSARRPREIVPPRRAHGGLGAANLFASAAPRVPLWGRCTVGQSWSSRCWPTSTARRRRFAIHQGGKDKNTASVHGLGHRCTETTNPRALIIKGLRYTSQALNISTRCWTRHRMEEAALSDPYSSSASSTQRDFYRASFCVRCAFPRDVHRHLSPSVAWPADRQFQGNPRRS